MKHINLFYGKYFKKTEINLNLETKFGKISIEKGKISAESYKCTVRNYVEAKDTREVINREELNAELKITVANIDSLRAEIDKIVAEIERV